MHFFIQLPAELEEGEAAVRLDDDDDDDIILGAFQRSDILKGGAGRGIVSLSLQWLSEELAHLSPRKWIWESWRKGELRISKERAAAAQDRKSTHSEHHQRCP